MIWESKLRQWLEKGPSPSKALALRAECCLLLGNVEWDKFKFSLDLAARLLIFFDDSYIPESIISDLPNHGSKHWANSER